MGPAVHYPGRAAPATASRCDNSNKRLGAETRGEPFCRSKGAGNASGPVPWHPRAGAVAPARGPA